MENNKMTWLQEAIYEAIKEHVANAENSYIAEYKPIEFIAMAEDVNRKPVMCVGGAIDGATLTHYSVRTRFQAEEYKENVAVWDVCLYSNGHCRIYFDGTMFG